VIAEVAHRFRHELLLWDLWGVMTLDLSQASELDLELIDEVADFNVRADGGDLDAELRLHQRFVEEDRLNPRGRVRTLSPIGSGSLIDLRTR
jgi:hypothetical protein